MSTFKRCISLLLVLCLVLSVAPITAHAVTSSGTCGDNLTWTLSDDGVLTISGTGPMEDYNFNKGYFSPWSRISSYVISVIIENDVTTIGDWAFESCGNLSTVEIGNSVTTIGDSAFIGCGRLKSVKIGNSVTTIGDSVFELCCGLNSVEIPNSVTTIGEGAFRCCESLNSVKIPDSVTTIGDSAFDLCESLSNVEFGNAVTTIGKWAFSHCYDLVLLTFRGDAPSIAANAFSGCSATACYPASKPTWTADKLKNYGGIITWVSYGSEELPFTDVPEGSFFYAPVVWAVENGITNGATETTFNPNGTCLRAQVVTFLHRAVGNPEPNSSNNPFTDVESHYFFYKPVLWAVEKGITNGISANSFGSYANCNRAAVVTFLWRAAGEPEPESTSNPFVDVKTTDFFYKPVLWAVENGITNGVDATHFGPATDCNRAQVVTFLYRAYN